MADNRYGEGRREGWRDRESSIFSDDDDRPGRRSPGWSGEQGRGRGGGRDDDRGFFERAGDEVRSWFGDEEAEQRRERDVRRDEGGGGFGGRDFGSRTAYGSSAHGGSDFQRGSDSSSAREQGGGFGQRSFAGRSGDTGQSGFGGGRSHWDDNYRRWRDQQIAQFDREYDDYCRERQQQFEQDFGTWRDSRLTEGGSSGQFGGSSSGETLQGSGGGAAGPSGSPASPGAESAGATTTGAGTAAAMPSSTGGSGGGRKGGPRS